MCLKYVVATWEQLTRYPSMKGSPRGAKQHPTSPEANVGNLDLVYLALSVPVVKRAQQDIPRPSKETKRPLVSTCFNKFQPLVSEWFRTIPCASQSSATRSEELQYQLEKKKKDAPGSQHPRQAPLKKLIRGA
jgi:hypothetical protein